MNGQISLFDFANDIRPGDYVENHGAVICHIMRPGYIGKMVVYDCSTASRRWYRAGILEAYIPYEDTWRSIIDIGTKQRILLTHRPGTEIYEVEPWNWEERKRRHKEWQDARNPANGARTPSPANTKNTGTDTVYGMRYTRLIIYSRSSPRRTTRTES